MLLQNENEENKNSKKRTKDNNNTHYNYSCNPRPQYVGTNPLLIAWRTRFDVAKEKKDKHDEKRTAKNQTTITTTAVPPALTPLQQTLSCLPGATA